MTIFAILLPIPQPNLFEAIKRVDPNDSMNLSDTQWLVSEIKDHRQSDFRWQFSVLGGGFLILAGMFITGYLRLEDKIIRLEDKIGNLTSNSIRVDTKLEDLLQRIPPIQSQPQQSQPKQ
jgi:hypothetical protein